MKQEIVSCDMCGKVRKSLAENWYTVEIVRPMSSGLHISFVCYKSPSRIEGKDVCGEVCAMRFFDRWLQHGNLEEGDPRPVKAQSA